MNKGATYLKKFLDCKGNKTMINAFSKENNITSEDFFKELSNYINNIKDNGLLNKDYIEYCLKYNNKLNKERKESKRKQTEKIINIISNYIKEDSHNIKEYCINYNLNYITFKKFINNSKQFYLTEKEKSILKHFLKRENEFNETNLEVVKSVVDKICDDLVNDKPYDILDYFKELGWNNKLLSFYINNNNIIFSNFIRDNVSLYFKKYHIDKHLKKETDLIFLVKNRYYKEDINKIINYINKNKYPYNIEIFNNIYTKYKNKKINIE